MADPPRNGRSLKTVTPGTSDVSPLSLDLRNSGGDLRQPAAFDRVYELRMGPGKTVQYARIDGALVAIFPRSTYAASPYGNVATIPPGTTFYIGRPEEIEARGLHEPRATNTTVAGSLSAPSGLISDHADLRVASPVMPKYQRPTLWNDTEFRRNRLGELLDLGERSSRN